MVDRKVTSCFDLIIAGCGGAGLSLAWHISQSNQLRQKKVLLIDSSAKQQNDRTWCFWTDKEPPYPNIQQKFWQKIQVKSGENEAECHSYDIAPLRYYYTKGADFYDEVKNELARHPNFTFCQEHIEHIDSSNSIANVRTKSNNYTADWVFSSLPVRIPQACLTTKQHFVGWFVRTQENAFDPDSARLMDFDTPQESGASFFYLLPLTANEALVEYTVISDQILTTEDYEQALRKYIDSNLGISSYEIESRERGAIPMTNYSFPRMKSERVMHIGTAAGMTKASTGFTFMRMQKDAQRIVNQLEKYGNPQHTQSSPSRFRFYDTLLLHILKHYPQEAPRIFGSLFRNSTAPKVLSFMSEDTSWWQEVFIVARLPWKPFLRSLWQYYVAPALSYAVLWKNSNKDGYVSAQPKEAQ